MASLTGQRGLDSKKRFFMTMCFKWLNEERNIVYVQMGKTFDIEELIDTLQQVKTMMKTVDHPVDLIVDQRNLKKLPPGLLSTIRSQIRTLPANRMVQVGAPPLMNALRQTLIYIPGVKDKFPLVADTLEEALELLEEDTQDE